MPKHRISRIGVRVGILLTNLFGSSAKRRTNLGVRAYARGDYSAAMRNLAAAAAAGEPTASYNLGVAYSDGLAVVADQVIASTYYRRAAEQGHVSAAFELGQAYRTARGVAQDNAEAARWYRTAAERGNYQAANELGLMYVEGKGAERDLIEGFAWIYTGTHQSIQYEPAFKNAQQLAEMLSYEQLQLAQARGREYHLRYIAHR